MQVDGLDHSLDEQVPIALDHRSQRAIGPGPTRCEYRAMGRIAYIYPGKRTTRTRPNTGKLIREGMLGRIQDVHDEIPARLDRIPQVTVRSENEMNIWFAVAS